MSLQQQQEEEEVNLHSKNYFIYSTYQQNSHLFYVEICAHYHVYTSIHLHNF